MAKLLSPYDEHGRVVIAVSVSNPKLNYMAGCEPNTFLDILTVVAIALLICLRNLDILGGIFVVVCAAFAFRKLRQLSDKPYGVQIYRRNFGIEPNLARGRRAAAYRSKIQR